MQRPGQSVKSLIHIRERHGDFFGQTVNVWFFTHLRQPVISPLRVK